MQKEKSTSRETELGRNENHAVSGKEGREVRMILEAGMAEAESLGAREYSLRNAGMGLLFCMLAPV